MDYVFVYYKDGKIKCYNTDNAVVYQEKLINDGWGQLSLYLGRIGILNRRVGVRELSGFYNRMWSILLVHQYQFPENYPLLAELIL